MNAEDTDFLHKVAWAARSARGALVNTLELAERCILDGVEGEFVECGVFAGVHPALMAYACQKHGVRRRIHLFDSFEGIPESGPRDDESITSCIGIGQDRLVSTGVSSCSLDDVKSLMWQWGVDGSLLVYHRGWFQNTAAEASKEIEKVAILRLDCDLYSSTVACLGPLYPKLVRGGYYVSDDFTLTGARDATLEYLASIGETVTPIQIEDGGGAHFWRRA